MLPEISIIIPAYNAEKTIKRMLSSITQQNFTDYEIIVVNDGSIDKTEEEVFKFKKEHKIDIVYYFQKNAGVSAARNKGMELAKGRYIFFCDADDRLKENALHALYDAITKTDCDVVLGGYDVVAREEKNNFTCALTTGIFSKKEAFKKSILLEIFPRTGNTLFEKEVVIKNNLFFINTAYAEDLNFFWKLIFVSNNVFVIKDVLYDYFTTQNSAMGKKYTTKRKDGIKSIFSTIWFLQKMKANKETVELMYLPLLRELKLVSLLIFDTIFSILNINKIKNIKDILRYKPKKHKQIIFVLDIPDKNHLKFFYYFPLLYCFSYRLYEKFITPIKLMVAKSR